MIRELHFFIRRVVSGTNFQTLKGAKELNNGKRKTYLCGEKGGLCS